MALRVVTRNSGTFRGLTFELSWHRRWDARARLAKMYRVPPTWPWWPAGGAPVERIRRDSPHPVTVWMHQD